MDYLIKNGNIIDTTQNVDRVANLFIQDGKIAEITKEEPKVDHVIHADGCYVVPGLIDFHTHIFDQGSTFGIKPDYLLSSGVTAAVDAGTAGTVAFEAFHSLAQHSSVTTKAFISLGATGLCDPKHKQNYEKDRVNRRKLDELLERFNDDILGIKISMSKEDVGSLGMEPIYTALELANNYEDKRVCVHSTDMPGEMDELLEALRPGDIVCHCFHGKGSTILNENGRIKDSVIKARERGILFDLANGMNHFDHTVAQKAIAQGFFPDVVSSDMVSFGYGLNPCNRSLPYVMSKLLCMGMPLNQIIKAATETPAQLMKLDGKIGSFKPQANADVAIFKIANKSVRFKDWARNDFVGNSLLYPEMTMKNGQVVFIQNTFNI